MSERRVQVHLAKEEDVGYLVFRFPEPSEASQNHPTLMWSGDDPGKGK